MNQKKEVTKKWCIVELFGHQKIAGEISEQVFAGSLFIRVDVPPNNDEQAFTRTFNPSAVYCFNWCTEETAIAYSKSLDTKPLKVYDIQNAFNKLRHSDNLTLDTKEELEFTEEDLM